MLANSHRVSTVVRVGAFMVFFFSCFVYFVPRRYETPALLQEPVSQVINLTELGSKFNASVVEFWQQLATALIEAKPQCNPLEVLDGFVERPGERSKPKLDKNDERRYPELTAQDETALLRAHYKMRRSAQHLAPKLPFSKDTTGIVTSANLESIPVLLVSLRMLRRTGCNLPVEVFLADWTHYTHPICERDLPSLNARCIILSNILSNATKIAKPEDSQHKSLSLLFSSFQNVLYVDTTAFPIYDPTILFTTPPYTTHGLVTWPDPHAPRISEHFYHIAAIPAPAIPYTSTSSQILLNKSLHRESLLLMLYYNHHGPSYYYLLLRSSAPAFALAALATRLPVYHVRSHSTSLGRWWNGTYRATGSAHADPGMDYEYLPPFSSHIHPSNVWMKNDTAHPIPSIEKALNYTRLAPRIPRPVFLQVDLLRMNPASVLQDKSEITFEPDGTPHRMWGLREDVVRVLGYDVEERLWGVVVEEGCRGDGESEVCRELVEWSREVVGWMGSIDRPW
ncbi:hypothetical protein CC86DRAFT_466779 [Ophiobolus disseminans]|uniref:Glycosyltransferase family 71 protein n=1 Tax=Ophiobolus disseminans TaxID=1469910 RepID=A0A6A7A125_9PLEO|nr:hypothetical protein CC86DRAFT_466779 [Ophiobolus disseminans]